MVMTFKARKTNQIWSKELEHLLNVRHKVFRNYDFIELESIRNLRGHLITNVGNVGRAISLFNDLAVHLRKTTVKMEFNQMLDMDEALRQMAENADDVYREYFRPYAYFIDKYKPDKGQAWKILKSVTDVPKFVKEVLGWDKPEKMFLLLLGDNICLKACDNPDCDSFSNLKCSGCNKSYYCDPQCQRVDYPRHIEMCKIYKSQNARTNVLPQLIQLILERVYEKPLLSMNQFRKIVHKRIFETFYMTMKTPLLDYFIHDFLDSVPQYQTKKKKNMFLLLKKKKRPVGVADLKRQLVTAYGNENVIF